MYEEYFGLVEKPFSLTPDPKYFYPSKSHTGALEVMKCAIRRREGFTAVTGDIGTGKTMLCRVLLETIDRNTFTALVLNPFLCEEDLLKLVLQDFGIVSRQQVRQGRLNGLSKQELIDSLYDFLLTLVPLRGNAVLIIDEAHNLPHNVLEQLRILSNLETDKEKLLQILLVGQLELQTLLRAPALRQLDQRISSRHEVKPLTCEETARYVEHRMSIASCHPSVAFEPAALDHVYRCSNGIPRLINLVCDRALFGACAAQTGVVSCAIVDRAVKSLGLPTASQAKPGWLRSRLLWRAVTP